MTEPTETLFGTIRFEPNHGQVDDSFKFVGRAMNYGILLKPASIELVLKESANATGTTAATSAIRLLLVNGSGTAEATGVKRLPGQTSYLRGRDRSHWITGVPHFEKVRIAEVYPEIDVSYYGSDRRLEFDFVIGPGGDPENVVIAIEGALGLRRADESGAVIVNLGEHSFRIEQLRGYQIIDGAEVAVQASFVVQAPNLIALDVGPYDESRELVIDPIIDFASYFGTDQIDLPSGYAPLFVSDGVAHDATGATYFTGTTFPLTDPTTSDLFVAKIIKPAGQDSQFEFLMTYIGGSSADVAADIAVDTQNRAVVGGFTASEDFYFGGAAPPPAEYGFLAFVLKLNEQGDDLVWSSAVESGPVGVFPQTLALDLSDNVYLGGWAFGPLSTLPVSSQCTPLTPSGPDPVGGQAIGIILKLDADGLPVFSTALAASKDTLVFDLAVDASGAIYATGVTDATDFPQPGLLQSAMGAGSTPPFAAGAAAAPARDAFLVKLLPDCSAVAFFTYLGGPKHEVGNGIALGADGSIFVAGSTGEGLNAFVFADSTALTNDSHAFVVRILNNGTSYVYTKQFPVGTFGEDVAVDPYGNAYVVGAAASWVINAANPAVEPIQVGYGGGVLDGYIARLNPTGTRFTFSSYLGGGGFDLLAGVSVGANGWAHTSGVTNSSDGFPVTAAFQADYAGGEYDLIVARVSVASDRLLALHPPALDFGGHEVGTSTELVATLGSVGTAAPDVTELSINGPDVGQFSHGGGCLGVVTADCPVSVTYAPQQPGHHRATLSIHSDAVTTPDEIPLSGTGLTLFEVQVEPSTLDFDPFLGGITFGEQSAPAVATVHNFGFQQVEVDAGLASGGDPGFTIAADGCSGPLASGASCDIQMVFAAELPHGPRTAELEIAADNASGQAEHTVSLQATVLAPQLATFVAPGIPGDSINFGMIPIDTPGYSLITVGNTGNAPSYLSALGSLPPGFEYFTDGITTCHDYLSNDWVLQAGGAAGGPGCDLFVAFEPQSLGLHEGGFTITSEPASQSVAVNVSGTGVPGVECGDTISGAVTLMFNHTCDGTALFIEEDDTVLDCAGRSLRCVGKGLTSGIEVRSAGLDPVSNVTIKNCDIRGCARGLFLWGVENATISNNTLAFNNTGIYGQDVEASEFSGNEIFANDGTGLSLASGQLNIVYGNRLYLNRDGNGHEPALFPTNQWNKGPTGGCIGNEWDDFAENPGFPDFYYLYDQEGSVTGIDLCPVWNETCALQGEQDFDHDGVCDGADNCRFVFNPDQEAVVPISGLLHILEPGTTTFICPGHYSPGTGAQSRIVVETDHVLLDCGGATLVGSGAGVGIAVVGPTADNIEDVRVRNCNVMNYAYGFRVHRVDGAILDTNRAIENNRRGIYLNTANGASLRGNSCRDNGEYGIKAEDSFDLSLRANGACGHELVDILSEHLPAYSEDNVCDSADLCSQACPSCENDQRDAESAHIAMGLGEDGVDCGGPCLNQDCCTNEVQDWNEDGIDCDLGPVPVCSARCIDCFADAGPGDGADAGYFALDDSDVRDRASEAIRDYVNEEESPGFGMDSIDIDTPDEIMEAMAWHVDFRSAWTPDFPYRVGPGVIDPGSCGMISQANDCTSVSGCTWISVWEPGGGSSGVCEGNALGCTACDFPRQVISSDVIIDSEHPNAGRCDQMYCGDCEDLSILRTALLRSNGIRSDCVFLADSFGSELPSLVEEGHTYSVVQYRGKWRIMEYGDMTAFLETPASAAAIGRFEHLRNVWNDEIGVFGAGVSFSVGASGIIIEPFGEPESPRTHCHNYRSGPVCPEELPPWSYSYTNYFQDVCP